MRDQQDSSPPTGQICKDTPGNSGNAGSKSSRQAHGPEKGSTGAPGILVLGMHRSGTSAVAGMLERAGAYLGEERELLPAHTHDNPTGYWERSDVVSVNDALLDASGYQWDRIAGLDPHRLSAKQMRSTQHQIVARLSRAGKPWLIKDPRLCLLLPQWLPLIERVACVVVVRDPREVAASMRDGPRGAFTSHYLIALWEKYLRIALGSLHGRPVIFIAYPAMLDEPEKQCQSLVSSLESLGIGGLHVPADTAIGDFLDLRLHRSRPKPHIQLSPQQQILLDWLFARCKAAQPQVVADVPEGDIPDEVLQEFEKTLAAQADRTRSETLRQTAEQVQKLESAVAQERAKFLREHEESRAHAQALSTELAQSRHMLTEVTQNLARSRESVEAAQARIAQLRTESDQNAYRLLQLQGDLEQQTGLATRTVDENRKMQRRIEDLANSLNRAGTEANRLRGHAERLEATVSALRSSWSWKLTAPLRALGRLRAPRVSWSLEQKLYRAYYAIPLLSMPAKRALILWVHRHAAWLTRGTLSFRLAKQANELEAQRAQIDLHAAAQRRMDQARADAIILGLRRLPTISLVMPVYNVERRWLMAAVNSVRSQYYPHWQLCIADDASSRAETRQALDEIARLGDSRIRIRRLKKNLGIAEASNAALALARGDYVGLLDHDDELTRDAILEMARAIDTQNADLIYSDEDKLDENGRHVEAHFKPDFSLDYLFSNNYICHFAVIRRSLLVKLGGIRSGFEGAQDFDLMLRLSEHTDRIAHIPKVLYHWRKIPGSTAADSAAKPQTSQAGLRALSESLRRRGITATAEMGPYPNTFRVHRTIAGEPLVSILIPFRDQADLLRQCVSSILEKTRYRNFEVLCIDNSSADPKTHAIIKALGERDPRIRFLHHPKPFNYSEINNFGRRHARGEFLLLLNNDTEVMSTEWVEAMLEHAQRPEVGIVGTKLLYPDKTIQHGGVVIGLGGVAGHAHAMRYADDPGYFGRAQLMQNLSAVTFACAMIRRDVYDRLGGLDETNLAVAFNDIDFCLRAREEGYLIVYTPYATLIHHESKSRGYEDTPEKLARFHAEVEYMQYRHEGVLKSGDPYYNHNLSLTSGYQPDSSYVARLPI
jgi:GT2 family glycosyltransferase